MEHFIYYFLKVNLVISLLCLFYWLFLRKENFFRLNRFFLLGSIVASAGLPLVPGTLQYPVQEWKQHIEAFGSGYASPDGPADRHEVPVAKRTGRADRPELPPFKFMFVAVYGGVAMALFARFLFRLSMLSRFVRRLRRYRDGRGFSYRLHEGQSSPFSFFGIVVINRRNYTQEQLQHICAHEAAHIHQWHTLDLLLAELWSIFLWMNPLMKSLKAFIRVNLEFIADDEVLRAGCDKKQYQLSLVQTCVNVKHRPLTNLFSSSKLKLRIHMMNTKKSPRTRLYKYALALPLVWLMYVGISLAGQPLSARDSRITTPDNSALEGYYLYTGDASFALRIQSSGTGLVLNELWSGKEIAFSRVSPLEFQNASNDFPLKFILDESDNITRLLAHGDDLWEKVNDLTPNLSQEFRLTPEELQAFAGYYQFEKDPDAYLQFSVKDNGLIAKQVWDGREFFILPKSALEFHSVKEQYPAKFVRDSDGKVAHVLVFNKDVWKKVAVYTPRKEIKLSPERLKAYAGRYTFQLEPGRDFFIQITAGEDHLVLKEEWSGNVIKFSPSSELEFYNVPRRFPLKFSKDSTGKVTTVLAFHRDLWTRVKE